MLIIRNLNLISVQSWTYLNKYEIKGVIMNHVAMVTWCITKSSLTCSPTIKYLFDTIRYL